MARPREVGESRPMKHTVISEFGIRFGKLECHVFESCGNELYDPSRVIYTETFTQVLSDNEFTTTAPAGMYSGANPITPKGYM
jgi:hypothetical protein